MRLPSVSLALAVWVLSHAAGPAPARAAAHEPVAVTSCLDLSEPAPADAVEVAATSSPAAAKAPEDVLPAAARPVPMPLDGRRLADKETYADVFRILREENECSRFFGGPALASEAFNRFADKLSRRRLSDRGVAVQMTGGYTIYQNHQTGETYRVFEQAVINLDGPVGTRQPNSPAAHRQVGRYAAYTPQARALALLHELGHLVAQPSGGWLLPDDGGDNAQSERNTWKVDAHCGDQLEAVRD